MNGSLTLTIISNFDLVIETYTFLKDIDALTQAQSADPALKAQLEQGTVPQGCSPGLRKCFLKDGLLCREYKESATQLTHIQIVIPGNL